MRQRLERLQAERAELLDARALVEQVAECCSVLQYVALCCSVSQSVALCCSML